MATPYKILTCMDLREAQRLLGEQIKALRRAKAGLGEKAISFGRLAKAVNAIVQRTPKVAGGTLQKWEAGKGHPDPWALLALAEIAGQSVEDFMAPTLNLAISEMPETNDTEVSPARASESAADQTDNSPQNDQEGRRSHG